MKLEAYDRFVQFETKLQELVTILNDIKKDSHSRGIKTDYCRPFYEDMYEDMIDDDR